MLKEKLKIFFANFNRQDKEKGVILSSVEVIKAILISLSPFVLISVVGGFFYFLKNKSVSKAELDFFKEKEKILPVEKVCVQRDRAYVCSFIAL